MTERKPPGMSFETWVDSQITRARDAGAFENLPGAGRPLPRRDRERTSFDWALDWARRESGDDPSFVAGMLPPGMALRRERDLLPAAVTQLESEAEARALAVDYNRRVREFWRRPQLTADVVPGLADAEALAEHWRTSRPPAAPAAPPSPAAGPPRVSWARRWFRGRTSR